MKTINTLRHYFTIGLFALLASCSSSDGTETQLQGQQNGRVSLLVTDGITDDFDQVNLTVESISFIGNEDGHETIVFDESRIINLLALQNYSDLLVTTVIPAGTYDKIRLHVSKVELVDFDGPDCQPPDTCITKLPANGKVDLNPRGSFEVIADGHLMVELDIDAEKSIHIIEKGNDKYSYNFRPVVFVNIVGKEKDETKLIVVDGLVTERMESSFRLCDGQQDEVETHENDNEHCLAITISGDTVVQDDLIDVVPSSEVDNGDRITVLGKAADSRIEALHIVIESPEKEISDLAMFNGVATSDFTVDQFTMETDDGNAIIQPLTALTIALVEGSGVRVFDKKGNILDPASIVIGTDVDVFGLAQPDIATVTKVKAAFIILDEEEQDKKLSGTIASIDELNSEITITDDTVGDVCVDTSESIIFILAIIDGKVVTKEITVAQLSAGMLVDAYGDYDALGCFKAVALLVAEPAEVSPASALLISGD